MRTRNLHKVPAWVKALKLLVENFFKGCWTSNEEAAKKIEDGYYFRNHVNKNGDIILKGVMIAKDTTTLKGRTLYMIQPSCIERALKLLEPYE